MSLTTRVNIFGRMSDPVWEHFNRIPSKSGKGWRATCKQCKLELQGIVARLKCQRKMSAVTNYIIKRGFYMIQVRLKITIYSY